MTPPWETFVGYFLVYGALSGLAWLLTTGLAQGVRRAATEHERRMVRVRAAYQRPFAQPSHVTAVSPRSDSQHVVVVPRTVSRTRGPANASALTASDGEGSRDAHPSSHDRRDAA